MTQPPMKRPLFNKPSWSKPQPTGSAIDMFSRSHEKYTDIVAEEKRERMEKLARKKQKQQGLPARDGVRQTKRRRISGQSGMDGDGSSGGDDDSTTEEPADSNDAGRLSSEATVTAPYKTERERPAQSSSKRCEGAAPSQDSESTSTHAIVVDLEDGPEEEDEADADITGTDAKTSPYPSDDDFAVEGLSDEEFPDIARKARERAQANATESHPNPDTEPEPLVTMRTKLQSAIEQPTEVLDHPPPDPVVKILITSHIPNTKPLIVHRFLSQRLKDVKHAWCERQGFPESTYNSIHLTWRGHKLFNVTTCKSLGMSLDEHDNFVIKGDTSQTPLSDDAGRIHMEAMTDEMIQEAQNRRDAKEEVEHEDFSEVQTPVKQTKITLKSKGCDDFKLLVKASTPILRIARVWMQQNNIAPDREVSLLFDGDRLDPELCVCDTELSDLDVVDVHIR